MDNGGKQLISVVLVVTTLSLVGAVLFFAGIPMAGTWSAIASVIVALALTFLMAFAFSHEPKSGH